MRLAPLPRGDLAPYSRDVVRLELHPVCEEAVAIEVAVRADMGKTGRPDIQLRDGRQSQSRADTKLGENAGHVARHGVGRLSTERCDGRVGKPPVGPPGDLKLAGAEHTQGSQGEADQDHLLILAERAHVEEGGPSGKGDEASGCWHRIELP